MPTEGETRPRAFPGGLRHSGCHGFKELQARVSTP